MEKNYASRAVTVKVWFIGCKCPSFRDYQVSQILLDISRLIFSLMLTFGGLLVQPYDHFQCYFSC